MLEELRRQVWQANLALVAAHLVAATSGNASARDAETGLVVIKPSGIPYDCLSPGNMAVVDLQGNVVAAIEGPSTDTASHLAIYRRRPDVNAVVHTHSGFATAFAAVGRPIPACLTAIADEFGGPVPCAPYVRDGDKEIGEAVVRHIGSAPAILLKQHGVYAIGATIENALKAAIMVEDAARTVWLALQIGQIEDLPADEVADAHDRYLHLYGTFAAGKLGA